VNNSDRTDYQPNRKTYKNAKSRELFGHAIFEHMVPGGEPVRVTFAQIPDAVFYLTINELGEVTVRTEIVTEGKSFIWHKGILDE